MARRVPRGPGGFLRDQESISSLCKYHALVLACSLRKSCMNVNLKVYIIVYMY